MGKEKGYQETVGSTCIGLNMEYMLQKRWEVILGVSENWHQTLGTFEDFQTSSVISKSKYLKNKGKEMWEEEVTEKRITKERKMLVKR